MLSTNTHGKFIYSIKAHWTLIPLKVIVTDGSFEMLRVGVMHTT
jgi:hypothetical protein